MDRKGALFSIWIELFLNRVTFRFGRYDCVIFDDKDRQEHSHPKTKTLSWGIFTENIQHWSSNYSCIKLIITIIKRIRIPTILRV